MDDPSLDVRIATSAHVSVDYPLVWLTPTRVRVAVPTGRAPLRAGARVDVALREPLAAEGLVLPAVVGETTGREADVLFLASWADPAVRTDRRGAFRVQPGRRTDLEVHLADGSDLLAASLVDLGPGGLCVDQPASLAHEEPIVQLLLPGRSWPLLLAARRTHHRVLGEGRARCGYAFVPERTADAETQLGSLAAWVEHFARALAGSLADRRVGAAR